MKTIARIARTELALLFYSPIAWFLMVALLFQAGLGLTNSLENVLISQDLGGYGLKFLRFLTQGQYSPPYGLWPDLAGKFYLYLPLITMGLMAREINGGTIKLLYSSPLKVREIIFGKFLAMMVYNLALILILAIMALVGFFTIKSADMGMLMAGLFGLYLLLCAYAAIGLFMSCLTSYQVVAALSTLVLLAFLSYCGQLWQGVDFVRDLTYFLSINGRADKMLLGLITSKDIIYFGVIISMFLSFSIFKLQADRESSSRWVKMGRYLLVLVCGLTIGYISSRPRFVAYYDATATKSMTLTANAQQVLKEMKDTPITVTSYINLLDNFFWYGTPEQRNTDLSRWEPYMRFKPDISLKYVYYYDSTMDKNLFRYNPGMTVQSLAERYAKSSRMDLHEFKTPEQIHQLIDLFPERNRYVMQLTYNNQKTFLRLFNDQMVFPSETETSAALKRLMQAKLPKIAFCQGESERSITKLGDRHYKFLTNEVTFRHSLINQGFDVETVFLKEQEIPAGITALVIADPRIPFDTASLRKIDRYIAEGGNLLIAGEPGKQEILNPLLRPLGVSLMEGMLVQENKDFSPALVQPFLTEVGAGITRNLKDAAEDSLPLAMHGAAALTFTPGGPFKAVPWVLTTATGSWNKRIKPDEDMITLSEDVQRTDPSGGGLVVMQASDKKKSSEAVNPALQGLAFMPAQGDVSGPLPVVLGLTRTIQGKEQRIVVAGDADFLSNAELARNNIKTCNFDFSTAIFSWFARGEFPIDSYRPPSKDNRLTLTDGGLKGLRILLLGVLPGILLVIGAILLIRRKRK